MFDRDPRYARISKAFDRSVLDALRIAATLCFQGLVDSLIASDPMIALMTYCPSQQTSGVHVRNPGTGEGCTALVHAFRQIVR